MNERTLLIGCIAITIILAIVLAGVIYYVGARNLTGVFAKSFGNILSDLDEMRDKWQESEVEER